MAKKKKKSSSRKQGKYGVFFINMSQSVGKGENGRSQGTGAFKLAWRAPVDAYPKEILTELGVNAVDEKKPEPGLVFGSNSPRPARVRINVQKKQGDSSSYTLFANPGQIPVLINGNALRGKPFKGGNITTVSLIGTSTNPTRKKNSNTGTNTKTKSKSKPKSKK